jgi:hypothetical protein
MTQAQRGARRRAGLIGLAVAVAAVGAAMLTMVMTAIFPALLRLSAPLLCPDGTVRSAVVNTRYGTPDGATAVESALYCIDAQGWAIEANGVAAYAVVAGLVALAVVSIVVVRLLVRMGRRRAVAAVAASVLLGACSWGTEDANAFDEATHLLGPFYVDGGAERVAADFADAVGAPVRVRSFVLYPDGASIEAQDPSRPERYDRYLHRGGKVRRPEPIDVSGDQIEGTLFGLDDLALDRIPQMVRDAVQESGVEGGDVTHIYASRRAGQSIEMTAFVDGLRGRAALHFDAAGNLLAE